MLMLQQCCKLQHTHSYYLNTVTIQHFAVRWAVEKVTAFCVSQKVCHCCRPNLDINMPMQRENLIILLLNFQLIIKSF